MSPRVGDEFKSDGGRSVLECPCGYTNYIDDRFAFHLLKEHGSEIKEVLEANR